MSKTRKISVFLLLAVFLTGLILVLTGAADNFDNAVMQWITEAKLLTSKFLYTFFKFFTDIGEAEIVISIVILFLIIPKTTKKIGIILAPIMISSWLSNTIIKNLVMRARPIDRFIEETSYSFPSGHAMNSTALYMTIMFLLLPFCKEKWQKVLLITVCVFFSISVSVSRLYFNVHFVTDVISGFALGFLFAIIGTQIYFNIKEKRNKLKEN